MSTPFNWATFAQTYIKLEYTTEPNPNANFIPYNFTLDPDAYWTSGDTMPTSFTLQTSGNFAIPPQEFSEARFVKDIPLGGLSILGGTLHGWSAPGLRGKVLTATSLLAPLGVDPDTYV